MKVLVTGFEPNDDGLNASELLVNSLHEKPTQELEKYADSLEFRVMPGDTNRLGRVVDETLDEIKPDVCIGVGQARGYNKIALERMAKNLRYFVTLDREGNAPKGEPIVPSGPIAYWHSLHGLDNLATLLEENEIPARVANDCGTHLCNQIFYHFCHWRERYNSDMRVGFVHIPALPIQVIQYWPEAPYMGMHEGRKALSLMIEKQIQAVTADRKPGEAAL